MISVCRSTALTTTSTDDGDANYASPVIVAADYSAVPALVWAYANTNTASGSMGGSVVGALSRNLFLGVYKSDDDG